MGLETIAALVSTGVGVAGAAGAFDPDMPASPDYARMTRDSMEAELELLPRRVAARQQYDPMLAALQNRIQEQSFFGTPAGKRTEEYTDYERRTRRVPAANSYAQQQGGYFGSIDPHTGRPLEPQYTDEEYTVPVTKTREVEDPGSMGLLGMAEAAQPRLSALERVARDQNLKDVRELGPEAFAAMQAYDPAQTRLLDRLAADAEEDLALGGQMNPLQVRRSQQLSRTNRADMGFGQGANDVFAEAFRIATDEEALRRQRQQFASGVANQRSATYGDPFLQVLGRSSGRTVSPQGFLLPESTMVSRGTDPNAAAYGLAGYNASNDARIGGYNARQGYLGSTIKGLGQTDWGNLFGGGGTGGTDANGLSYWNSGRGGGIGGLPVGQW